ncbi:NAD-dependent epimerase/dehydratase family protein [Amycolatopsis sp. NPDC005232]|uniref:NAD-dependent epimerase/dehydratase family protein n=1 Tax=Amycolatopsis sp. NPDC005232 TaxID=3157027 RepID=UPI0033B6B419
MKVLVTGANGYLGLAIAAALDRHGHEVHGMARTEAGRRTVAAAGIFAVAGDLDSPEELQQLAAGYDAVVETANADHSASAHALVAALSGTDKTLIRTSGTGVYSDLAGGNPSAVVHTEDAPFEPLEPIRPRYELDDLVLNATGLRGIVIRPSLVYGYGGSQQLPVMLRAALRHGFSGFLGAGLNVYGNVYLEDQAEVYALALEMAEAGSAYNVAADEMPFAQIASLIGSLADVPTRPFADDAEAAKVWGSWVHGLGSNTRVDSAKAVAELGWLPVGPSLEQELTSGSYKKIWGDAPLIIESTATSAAR